MMTGYSEPMRGHGAWPRTASVFLSRWPKAHRLPVQDLETFLRAIAERRDTAYGLSHSSTANAGQALVAMDHACTLLWSETPATAVLVV